MKLSQVSRRQFLVAAGGVLAASSALPFLDGMSWAVPAATLPRGGAPFAQPPTLTSQNGRLDVKLVAAPSMVPFGSGRRFAYTYNGSSPGPTLRVRPGDVVSVTLVNRLGEPTNLHTHGLHVSPSGHADNIFVSVPDDGRRNYVYEIPADHRSGTFWYHPHVHGMVAPQVFGGLAGAIIVDDEIDERPELAGATERVLVLSDPAIGTSSSVVNASGMERMLGREGDVVLVNGIVAPAVASPAGSLEHWRLLNASPSRYYRLALESHPFHVIGTDGGRLAEPRTEDELLLAPGERVEVVVAPTASGTYRLDTLPYNRGSVAGRMGLGGGSSARTRVATMVVSGTSQRAAVPSSLAAASSLTLPARTARRELVFAMGMGNGGMGGGGNGGFTINGKSFDMNRTDITTTLGRVEDWTITNTSTMDHPFHLHVWPFQVVARTDGAPITPGWKDTVNVPAGHSVTARVPITDTSGRTVYHCHILDHEDLGMMGVIDVAPERA